MLRLQTYRYKVYHRSQEVCHEILLNTGAIYQVHVLESLIDAAASPR